MTHPQTVPAIVVGIDGSPAARNAAVWAAAGAAARAVPLKLVYVIYDVKLPGRARHAHSGENPLATAQAALYDARRAAEQAVPNCDVGTQVLWGNPLATLIELSHDAVMICVGSVGVEHSCHRAGSTAAALAGSARCPVAVIHPDPHGDPGRAARPAGDVVAEVGAGSSAALGVAMAEARLRGAAVRAVASCGSHHDEGGPDDAASRVRARLTRQIDRWAQRYPDVPVEPVAVPGEVTDYLSSRAGSIQLFISDTHDRRTLGWAEDTAGYSVLTLGETTQ